MRNKRGSLSGPNRSGEREKEITLLLLSRFWRDFIIHFKIQNLNIIFNNIFSKIYLFLRGMFFGSLIFVFREIIKAEFFSSLLLSRLWRNFIIHFKIQNLNIIINNIF